ncbi:MAG: radical SAM/SPASM domain-containing protein [Candidatus Methanospirareceae archaeon]
MLRILLPLRILDIKMFKTLSFCPFSLRSPPMPINFTVSVTNRCNSRCKTCNIWRIYKEQPGLRELELSVEEFKRIFESIGKRGYWFTISGGEPFLRKDIVEIYEALIHYCSPNIINIPTNATLPRVIEDRVREFLEIESKNKHTLIINLSLDGVGSLHDEIRGTKGNFSAFLDTYNRLEALKEEYKQLRVGVHTVISVYNITHINNIYDFVRRLDPKPDSHIFEVAEERVELNTVNSGITPDHHLLSETFMRLREEIERDYLRGDFLSRITQSFRLEYYEIIERILRERRQIIPCYAAYASCQISPYGEVWACCVLAKSLGNLRDVDYDFRKVWGSEEAKKIRVAIKRGECYCPLANAMYTSMVCSFSTMKKVLWRVV